MSEELNKFRPFGIFVLWILSILRIFFFFTLTIACHLAYLECIKGPGLPPFHPPYCPRYELYLSALGFLDIAILASLRRPSHHRLSLAFAFDVFLCAIGTLAAVDGLWRFSLQLYANAIWLISIAHAAIFIVPRIRQYYRTSALTGPQS